MTQTSTLCQRSAIDASSVSVEEYSTKFVKGNFKINASHNCCKTNRFLCCHTYYVFSSSKFYWHPL